MQLKLAQRSIVNPGSVGQPRDRDPRAAFGIYDSEQNTFEFNRAHYDFTVVQERMEAANLPERHIQRLSAGW
jgi:diadenosine tetraphosphatase ApaH/serine/threonine PP2A family protein phosphatase